MNELQKTIENHYQELSLDEQKRFHEMWHECSSADEMYNQLEKVIFRMKPPTPEEYLDPKNEWVTKAFSDSIYDHIKEDFIEILSEKSNYTQVVEYGCTRCEAENTPILMHDLSIKMIQDIQVGDLLMGEDSTPRTVLETVTGEGDLYEVHQNKGDNYTVNENHILVLQNIINYKIVEISVKDFLELKVSYQQELKGIKLNLFSSAPGNTYSRTNIKIKKVESGKFYGFALDGDQRYLHSDLTITHNSGKSFLERLIIHYIIIYVHCLRHPQLYYGLSPTTNLSIYIMSFVAEKVNQLLLKPIYDILMMSPRFMKVDRQDAVAIKQKEIGLETIVWSKAATFGKLTLESRLSLNIGVDFLSFIGADLLFLAVSEINFFIQQAGVSHEQIFQLYTDGLDRIKATVGGNYLGMIYLDSSANDIENPIEKYILSDLQKQEGVFFKSRSRWEARPHMFPKWLESGETFKVCTGDGTTAPKIITDDKQLKDINKKLIIEVPIDSKPDFERNVVKSIKDIAGLPTQRENRLIQDSLLIENLFSNEFIENIEGAVIADSASNPEKLIWNQIQSRFFIKTIEGKYRIKRAYREPRWVYVDPAFSNRGDLAGIAMGHKERSTKFEKTIYVLDFAFCVAPGKNGINLAAIENFILDLKYEGNVYVKYFSSDSFQNAQFKQNLARNKIETSVLSVDRTIDPYSNFINCMFDETVKVGKNIFLKNNLLSLVIERDNKGKDKIDHIKGKTEHKYFGDWDYSQAGINDKDCSDGAAGVVYNMFNSEIIPTTIYETENAKNEEIESKDSSDTLQKALLGIRSAY